MRLVWQRMSTGYRSMSSMRNHDNKLDMEKRTGDLGLPLCSVEASTSPSTRQRATGTVIARVPEVKYVHDDGPIRALEGTMIK